MAIEPPPSDNLSAPMAKYAEEVAEKSEVERNIPQAQSIHGISQAEKAAFVKHVNKTLKNVPVLSNKLPIDPQSNDIFVAVQDGVLLCELVNASVPRTIDDGKIIKVFKDEKSKLYHQLTNHNLCLAGARKIGAIVVNVGAEDLLEGKPYLVFGLLWQIIKIGLLKEVSLAAHPELAQMTDEDLSNLPPEELLLKWFNYHLKKSGSSMRVENFGKDIQTSKAYIELMHRLNPQVCTLEALNELDPLKRAEIMLMNAERLGIHSVVTPEDIVAGNERLNLVFTASLFNSHTGMSPIVEENETLTTENQELKSKSEVLEKKLQALNMSIQTQTMEMQKLETVKTQVYNEVAALRDEKNALLAKINKVLQENQLLSGSVKSIAEQKKALELSKESLAGRYDQLSEQLMKTTEDLERERISLETSEFCGASLANDLEELRGRQEKMEYLIEHLKIERMRSDMHIERLRVLYNGFKTTEDLCLAIYKQLTLENLSQNASKMGYLTKKARNGNSWKYRYFILRDNFLFYFRSDKDPNTQANGVIRVDDAVLRFAENPTRRDLKDQWLLCIEIPNNNDLGKQNSFYIAGEDHELEGWKSAIRVAAGWWTRKSSVESIKRSIRLTS